MRVVGVGTFIVISLVACTGGQSSTTGATGAADGGVDAGNPFADVCTKQAAAECALEKKCDALTYAELWATDQTCIDFRSLECGFNAGAADSSRSPADVTACATAIAGASCTDLLSCTSTHGTRANGTTCQFDGSCQSGYCAVSALCGVCAALPAAGARCGTHGACDDSKHLYCDSTLHCVPLAAAGGACGTKGPEPYCDRGMVCVKSKCGSGGMLGDACAADSPCDPTSGLACDATTMKCAMATYAPPGASCGGATLCAGGNCVQGKCAAYLVQGNLCDATAAQCLYPLECDHGSGCQLPVDASCNP